MVLVKRTILLRNQNFLLYVIDFPVAVSFPHFMNADPIVHQRLEGLEKPDPEKHGSYVIVEPVSKLILLLKQ